VSFVYPGFRADRVSEKVAVCEMFRVGDGKGSIDEWINTSGDRNAASHYETEIDHEIGPAENRDDLDRSLRIRYPPSFQ
jgi:hypothetical protein